MKTILISLAIALLSFAKLAEAQNSIVAISLNPNIAPILQGSLLCGDEVKRITSLPAKLRSTWYWNTNVEIDTLKRSILLKYYFRSFVENSPKPFGNPTKDTLITSLNEYLPKNIDFHLNEANLSWDLKEQYYLDDTIYDPNIVYLNGSVVNYIADFDMYNREANPFQKCFTVNNVCDKLQVVRHEVKPICPGYVAFSKYDLTIVDLSFFGDDYIVMNNIATLSFVDSIAYYPINCLAIGNIIKTDTINFENLSGRRDFQKFIINEKKTQIVYCVTTPCNPLHYNLVYNLGGVYLPSCLQTGIEPELPINDVVYPNPATDKLFVKGVLNITLIDVLGNKSTLKGNGEFDIEGLNSGLYLLNYEINGENYSNKILIQ